MQFSSSLIGKNPKIAWHYNAWCKTNSIAIVKTRGKLGTFKIDCIKVALGALALLAACLIGAPISFILVGVGCVCLFASTKRYSSGPLGEAQAEGSQAMRTVLRGAEDVVQAVTDVFGN